MKQTTTRRHFVKTTGVTITCANPESAKSLQNRHNGDLSVDVTHQSGDQATEVNALVIWQDDVGGSPYNIIEDYPSIDIPYNISGLPGGHDYRVNAYINDQLAGGTGPVSISSGDSKTHTITVENSVWIRPRVFDNTGEQNPLTNAQVRIRTQEDDPDFVWRNAETTSDGFVDTPEGKLWLHPTSEENGIDEGYYVIDILFNGDKVGGERIDTLVSNRDLEMATSAEPTPTSRVSSTSSPAPVSTSSPTLSKTPTPAPTKTGTEGQEQSQEGTETLPIAIGILGLTGLGGASAWWMAQSGDEDSDNTSTGIEKESRNNNPDSSGGGLSSSHQTNSSDVRSQNATAGPQKRTVRLSDRRIPESVPMTPNVSVDYHSLIDKEQIGRGGNASVKKSILPTTGGDITLAIKEPISVGETVKSDDIERLISEAETWDKIDEHDYIVDVVDWGTEPGFPWIAMEYMDGGHLGDRSGEMDLPQALWTAIAVTKGVRHAHIRGVVHLDLKPENILFRTVEDAWDVPKVTDWGLSKHLLEHSKSIEGMSPHYAAPEQFEEEYGPTDNLTDIYQLGAVFYELVTGRPPFEGRPMKIMRAVMDEQPTPPSEVADVPKALDDVLLTALAKEKDDRYEDILLLRNALQDLFADY